MGSQEQSRSLTHHPDRCCHQPGELGGTYLRCHQQRVLWQGEAFLKGEDEGCWLVGLDLLETSGFFVFAFSVFLVLRVSVALRFEQIAIRSCWLAFSPFGNDNKSVVGPVGRS